MTWTKVDDQLHIHPKVRKAGPPALGLHLIALSYCGYQYQTEGFIANEELGFLFSCAGFRERDGRKAVKRLAEVGLWDAEKGGYRLHDWLVFNRSADQVDAERDATLQRVQKLRQRKRSSRQPIRQEGLSNHETNRLAALSNAARAPRDAPQPDPGASATNASQKARGNSSPPIRNGVTPTVTPPVTGGATPGVSNASPVPVPVPVTLPNPLLDQNGAKAEAFVEVQGQNASAVNEALASIQQRAEKKPAVSGFVRTALDTFAEVAGRTPTHHDMATAREWEREYRYLEADDARRTMRKAAAHWQHQDKEPARTLKAFTEWIQRENSGLADGGRRKSR